MTERQITGDMVVGDVLADTPETLGIFVEHGVTVLKDPVVRRTVAGSITVAEVAGEVGASVDQLVDHLNDFRSALRAAGCSGRSDGPVTAHHCPGQVIEQYPNLLDVFVRHGFEALRDPVLRRSVASMVTIETACRMHGVDAGQLLSELNAAK